MLVIVWLVVGVGVLWGLVVFIGEVGVLVMVVILVLVFMGVCVVGVSMVICLDGWFLLFVRVGLRCVMCVGFIECWVVYCCMLIFVGRV